MLKKIVYGFLGLFLLFLMGCNNPLENKKYGVKCDDSSAIMLAEKIINEDLGKGKISIKIDTNNIVEWDYKDGRYLCKAKINGTYDKNLSFTKKLMFNNYGIIFNKNNTLNGWIYYQTYLPTVEMKKLKNNESYVFYSEVLNATKLPEW